MKESPNDLENGTAMKEIDLTPYGFTRPEKISWSVAVTGQDALEIIKSKSLRSFLRKTPELLAAHGITHTFAPIDKDTFRNWLGFYHQKMTEHQYDVLATEEWYDKRTAEGRQIYGLFFYREGQMVGSGIINMGKDKGTLSYKASDRIELASQTNSSFGAIIDYLFMQNVIELGKSTISAGTTRNAFGVINTLGALDFKLRMGYQPQPAKTAELLNEVPVNQEGQVLFYGLQDGQLKLVALTPEAYTGSFEVARFATPELPFEHLRYN